MNARRSWQSAATEGDDQVVDFPNPRKKSLQLHGIARVYCVPSGSITDGGRSGHGLVWRASGHPDLRARATQFDRRSQTDARSAPDDNCLLLLKHTVLRAHGNDCTRMPLGNITLIRAHL
jgi:hypothetical protein